jgi:hypothetical protein
VSLTTAAGWGDQTSYDSVQVRRSIESYRFVAHARADDGFLVGYVSASRTAPFPSFLASSWFTPLFVHSVVGCRWPCY